MLVCCHSFIAQANIGFKLWIKVIQHHGLVTQREWGLGAYSGCYIYYHSFLHSSPSLLGSVLLALICISMPVETLLPLPRLRTNLEGQLAGYSQGSKLAAAAAAAAELALGGCFLDSEQQSKDGIFGFDDNLNQLYAHVEKRAERGWKDVGVRSYW